MTGNNRAVLAAALAVALACKGGTSETGGEGAAPAPAAGKTPEAAPSAPADASGTTPAASGRDPSLKSHMQSHFFAIRQIQRAIVSGGVEAARQVAADLAEHPAHDAVAEYGEELVAVQAAARTVAAASTLYASATATATLVGECGKCHSMMTKIVSFEWHDVPEDTGDIKQRMQRHLWAMERLWEGLVGPSDRLWTEGAAILAAKPLPAEVIARDAAVRAEVKGLAARLQELGGRAAAANDRAARVGLYGELLSLCAGCHSVAKDLAPSVPEP